VLAKIDLSDLCGEGGPGRRKLGVLAQDRLLEGAKRGARLDAELLEERRARGPVRAERFGLPAGAVQRDHELPAKLLAQGIAGDEIFDASDELGVPPELQLRADELLLRKQAQLLEPRCFREGERLELELREGGASPERESVGQRSVRWGAA